jgi:hypothetical protein
MSLLALLFVLPLQLDQTAAAARLAELRIHFVRRPKAESVQALQELVNEAPDTVAAARACNWLGDLWRSDHDDALAAGFYRRAYGSHDRSAHVLAARGLADLALSDRRYRPAYELYREARSQADGEILAAELDQKIVLARRQYRRSLWEYVAWSFVIGTIVWFVTKSRFWRTTPLEPPVELIYAAPMYALLIAACLGRDPQVLHALWLAAVWSLALITASGLAARRAPPAKGLRVLAPTALLATSTFALFFAACNRSGIIDSLFFTIAP